MYTLLLMFACQCTNPTTTPDLSECTDTSASVIESPVDLGDEVIAPEVIAPEASVDPVQHAIEAAERLNEEARREP